MLIRSHDGKIINTDLRQRPTKRVRMLSEAQRDIQRTRRLNRAYEATRFERQRAEDAELEEQMDLAAAVEDIREERRYAALRRSARAILADDGGDADDDDRPTYDIEMDSIRLLDWVGLIRDAGIDLTEAADSFLVNMKGRANDYATVRMTQRQFDWLEALVRRARGVLMAMGTR